MFSYTDEHLQNNLQSNKHVAGYSLSILSEDTKKEP